MKIAVFASGAGEKALHLHNFFKEGNRVEVDCLITDREDSPAIYNLRGAGVETYTFPQGEWAGDGESIADFLTSRGIELIVLDDLESELPEKVRESFGEAILTPSGVKEAPGEVVNLYNQLRFGPAKTTKEKENSGPLTPEEEWARVLKIDYDPEEESPAPPPMEEPEETEGDIDQNSETSGREGYALPPEPENPQYGNVTPPQEWNNGPVQPNYPGPQGHDGFSRPQETEEPMPKTYLLWAVLATVLCCLIPGIVAIVFSSSVSSRYYAGDIEGARRASQRAQIWIIVSIVCGIIWGTLYFPLTLFTL